MKDAKFYVGDHIQMLIEGQVQLQRSEEKTPKASGIKILPVHGTPSSKRGS